MNRSLLETFKQQLWDHEPGLCPDKPWNKELDDELAGTPVSDLYEGAADADPYALCVKSGLHLWNESLNRSHSISQEVENTSGSYWHGIMHRMEGDYGNAKYWFRRVGDHPVYVSLAREAVQAAEGRLDDRLVGSGGPWDPYRMVDLVEKWHAQPEAPEAQALRSIQRREIALLLDYVYRRSTGGAEG
ncbi:hypothetical protein N6H14_32990 [Paenibacillus sp. CC-CFT747]|nr:hypothetical protein N6H14_32990 [Paenibacillus sp. CC-CFT747]